VQRDLVHLDREHEKTKRTYLKPSERYFIGGFSFGGMVAAQDGARASRSPQESSCSAASRADTNSPQRFTAKQR
jgi:alpha/beta superfamily hydrolase